MIELLGPMRPEFSLSGKYSKEFFTSQGELRYITHLKYWNLENVLHDKYGYHRQQARDIASFLLPMLRYEHRAKAVDLLNHPWIQHTDPPVPPSYLSWSSLPYFIYYFTATLYLSIIIKKNIIKIIKGFWLIVWVIFYFFYFLFFCPPCKTFTLKRKHLFFSFRLFFFLFFSSTPFSLFLSTSPHLLTCIIFLSLSLSFFINSKPRAWPILNMENTVA